MANVIPLIHFADQPRDRAEQEGDAAVKLRRNRKYWNRRQPKRPPNRMKAGAEICEYRGDETGRSNEKKFRRSHSKNVQDVIALH